MSKRESEDPISEPPKSAKILRKEQQQKKYNQPKKLSHKERKRLEKIVERKKNKDERPNLYAELTKYQVNSNVLSQMGSVAMMHIKEKVDVRRAVEIGSEGEEEVEATPQVRIKKRGVSAIPKSSIKGQNKGQVSWRKTIIQESSSEESDLIDESSEDEAPKAEIKSEPIPLEPEVKQEISRPDPEPETPEPPKKPIEKEPYPIPDLHILNRQSVSRDPAIQILRDRLPVCHEEQSIVEAIKYFPVVIVSGETGSGKTTQIPQFLYESGFCHIGPEGKSGAKTHMIGVTEPRRVAAMSMSKRVAVELNLPESQVSYQIRYESNRTDDTKLLFMTDGVLLKEIKSDFLLTKYSVIIIDEAHERSVHSDILIGLLSRILCLRWRKHQPLRLIIMSATLRINDFLNNSHLFGEKSPLMKLEITKFHQLLHQHLTAMHQIDNLPRKIKKAKTLNIKKSDLSLPYLPCLNIKARQFDVKKYHLKKTPEESEYLNMAISKVGKIHSTLPDGDILVFVATSNECNYVCKGWV